VSFQVTVTAEGMKEHLKAELREAAGAGCGP
jgi:hypothetical protein